MSSPAEREEAPAPMPVTRDPEDEPLLSQAPSCYSGSGVAAWDASSSKADRLSDALSAAAGSRKTRTSGKGKKTGGRESSGCKVHASVWLVFCLFAVLSGAAVYIHALPHASPLKESLAHTWLGNKILKIPTREQVRNLVETEALLVTAEAVSEADGEIARASEQRSEAGLKPFSEDEEVAIEELALATKQRELLEKASEVLGLSEEELAKHNPFGVAEKLARAEMTEMAAAEAAPASAEEVQRTREEPAEAAEEENDVKNDSTNEGAAASGAEVRAPAPEREAEMSQSGSPAENSTRESESVSAPTPVPATHPQPADAGSTSGPGTAKKSSWPSSRRQWRRMAMYFGASLLAHRALFGEWPQEDTVFPMRTAMNWRGPSDGHSMVDGTPSN